MDFLAGVGCDDLLHQPQKSGVACVWASDVITFPVRTSIAA
jgi:hypothetical protein